MLVHKAALRAAGEGGWGQKDPGLAQDEFLGCIRNQPWWDVFLRRGQGANQFVTLQAFHGSLITLGFDRLSCALT